MRRLTDQPVVLVGSDDNGRWADVWDGGEITRIAGVQWAGAADDRELASGASALGMPSTAPACSIVRPAAHLQS